MFDYPYVDRKSEGDLVDFQIPDLNGTYQYNHETLFFDRSETCHIDNLNNQLTFFDWWVQAANQNRPVSYMGDGLCNRNYYFKIKYSHHKQVSRALTDSPDQNSLMIGRISLENGLNKVWSVRSQYGVNLFDEVVAKVGGVLVIFYVAASIIGYFFSQWLFVHRIAEDLYLEKKHDNKELSDDEAASFGHNQNQEASQDYEGGKKGKKKNMSDSEAYESGSNANRRNSASS